MSILPQQPSTISEIRSNSPRLYVKSFPKWIGYSLIALLVSMLMILLMTFSFGHAQESEPGNEIWLIELIAFVVLLLTYISTIYRIDNVVNEREDDFVQPLLLAVKKLPSIILGTLYLCLILMIVAMLLGAGMFGLMNNSISSMNDLWGAISLGIFVGIPGVIIIIIIISISWLLFGYFILFEDLPAYQSLVASYRLVRGHWWRTFLVFFLPIVLIVFISIFSLSFDIYIFDCLLSIFFIPYFLVLSYLQYHDLKLRKIMLK